MERICNQTINHTPDEGNVRKTALVVFITLVTMFAEIFYAIITGSMSLLADGIHMGTHTFALVVTLIAYRIAGRHTNNPNFSFSSGKVGVLGGYTNAIILAIAALFAGKLTGSTWPDAVVALLGALVITKWAYGLLLSSGRLLVDYYPAENDIRRIRDLAREFHGELEDIHIWRISENQQSLILSVRGDSDFDKEKFSLKVKEATDCSHMTLELI